MEIIEDFTLLNQWGISGFHAILVSKNWSLSDPDPANK